MPSSRSVDTGSLPVWKRHERHISPHRPEKAFTSGNPPGTVTNRDDGKAEFRELIQQRVSRLTELLRQARKTDKATVQGFGTGVRCLATRGDPEPGDQRLWRVDRIEQGDGTQRGYV